MLKNFLRERGGWLAHFRTETYQGKPWFHPMSTRDTPVHRVIYGVANFPSTRYVGISFGSGGGEIARDPLKGRGGIQLQKKKKLVFRLQGHLFRKFWGILALKGMRRSFSFLRVFPEKKSSNSIFYEPGGVSEYGKINDRILFLYFTYISTLYPRYQKKFTSTYGTGKTLI